MIALAIQALCLPSCGEPAAALTLLEYLDYPKFPKLEVPEETFVQSAFDLGELLSSGFAAKEVKDATVIAKNLRVVIATQIEGTQTITAKDVTLREFLKAFASKWKVVVLLDKDTIMIVDPYDVSRFPHHVAITPDRSIGRP